MVYERDPVSELLDGRAAAHLRACYAARGGWCGRPLPQPPLRMRAAFLLDGINLDGADPTAGTRWIRAYIRSLYYVHKWYYRPGQGLDLTDRRMAAGDTRGLRYEIGTRAQRLPGGRGFGTPVRIRLRRGGEAGYAAVPALARYTENAGVRSDPRDRDWEAAGAAPPA